MDASSRRAGILSWIHAISSKGATVSTVKVHRLFSERNWGEINSINKAHSNFLPPVPTMSNRPAIVSILLFGNRKK